MSIWNRSPASDYTPNQVRYGNQARNVAFAQRRDVVIMANRRSEMTERNGVSKKRVNHDQSNRRRSREGEIDPVWGS